MERETGKRDEYFEKNKVTGIQLMDRYTNLRTIFIFFAMGVVIKICFKTHGEFEDVEAVVG